ncbi:cbb3-type cytochrome oxidase assembly protein CcoS [Idiomarina xiamenensis]|uniref:Cbb3-type cytochrome oxidase maturation protein n=1 Tax=Idiomarina xiamenensis 10-D-4 TaxID=740709 RepID=K2KWX2_9GAMM|nr:cbb3-type cytochrome oxidase assembly protein CcoS [Idiomarina xiamenensis]EKE86999.1 cbb3-type cytochrome oxidase maturation protein [Idiomarina xiamenensis 10-D-4]
MSVIYVLIPIAMIIVAIGVAIFFWAVRSNQFEDIERQGMSILLDDEDEQQNAKPRNSANTDQQQRDKSDKP